MNAPTFRRPLRGEGRLLLGVGAGLARRWDLEPRTVRIALGVTLLPFGAGLLVYAALALVMPADGASEAEAGWRGEIGQSIAEALLVLAVVLAVGLIGGFAAGLAVFGLASVALLLATAALAGVILVDHTRSWLFGVAALALAVPGAVVELTNVSVARQIGDVRAAITRPQDVQPAGYRVGLGSLLLDLRDFDAEERTATTIRARADVRPIVVALPTDRCFNLEIDYALDRSWLTGAVLDARRQTFREISALGYPQEFRTGSDGRQEPVPTTLIAYGRAIPGTTGRYVRPTANPAAPTLRLQLGTSRSQVVVRDYPLSIDPLKEPRWPVEGAPDLVSIYGQVKAAVRTSPTYGVQPGTRALVRVSGRTAAGAISDAIDLLVTRYRYPILQARKLAGACAAPKEVRAIRSRLHRNLELEARQFKAERGRSDAGSMTLALVREIDASEGRRPIVRDIDADPEPSLFAPDDPLVSSVPGRKAKR